MDPTTLNAFKKSVECVICHEPQFNPKHLPCHHSFCKECIDDMMKFDDDGSATIICPMKCVGDVLFSASETSNSLPNNYSLQSVLDIITASYDSKETICNEINDCTNGICRSCSNCGKRTCAVCWDKHLCENKAFTAITFDQHSSCFHPWCAEHQAYAKRICIDCDERFVCSYCEHRSHKGHETKTIENYAQFTRTLVTSNINVGKDYLQQSDISYEEEMIRIELFRMELERELQDKMLKQLSSYSHRLIRERDVLLNNFDVNVSRFKDALDYSNLLGTNVTDRLTAYDNETTKKQDYEIISERNAILRKIKSLSMLHTFKANINNKCSEKDILGQLNVEYGKRNHASMNRKDEIVELHMERIYENKMTKENDLKSLMECITDVEDSIRNDQIDELKLLAKQQPNIIHMKEVQDFTILHKAAAYGKDRALETLLQIDNESVNKQDSFGYTALMYASSKGHEKCLDILLEHNADMNIESSNGETALICACNDGRSQCVKILLGRNADVESRTSFGDTPLIQASRYGRTNCLKVLLEHNADVNIKNNDGDTALIEASGNGFEDCVKILLGHNADTNVKNSIGYTALISASLGGYEECVKMLLEANSDVSNSNTAYTITGHNGNIKYVP